MMYTTVMYGILFSLLGLSSAFTHGWDTAGASSFADFRTTNYWTEDQLDFAAANYRIVSVEKCSGTANGTTEEGIYHTAQLLKKKDPTIKVIFYWATDQQGIRCYGANDKWIAHPEWQLLTDDGNLTGVLDCTNEAARSWWLSVPLGGIDGTGLYNGQQVSELIDGVLADSGGYQAIAGVSVDRLEKHWDAKLSMMGALQAAFTSANNGEVMANGISMYPVPNADPRLPDDHLVALQYTNSIMNEHTAVFECINATNSSFNLDTVSTDLNVLIEAAKFANGSKTVYVQTWPGLYVSTSFTPTGTAPASVYPPGGEATPQNNDEWRNALRSHFQFAQALFLSIAEENMFWMYAGYWYESHTGYLPCPEDPDSCCAPSEWYPDLKKPLGKPLGARTETSPYVWDRQFEHASVHFDLNQPNLSKVTYASDSHVISKY